MPKRKLSFKMRKRSTKKRRRSRRSFIPRNLIPTKMARRFKYATSFQLDPTITQIDNRVFSCNGMYDPDITGVGHQPMGFDQYIGTLYDHYTVIGAKITCTFLTLSANALLGAARVGITVRDVNTPITSNMDTLVEQGSTRMRVVSPLSSNNRVTMSYKVNPPKFLGNSSPMNNENLKGNAGANPTEQCFFQVFAANVDDASNASALQCMVTIEYLAVLTERKWLDKS